MDLDELQSVRDRERQTDKLQQLRETFYADAGEFIQALRDKRDRAAERADDPFDAPEVSRLSDEIDTAEGTVEAIYEKRVGKIVKAASFAAADLPAESDGMTAEEKELFETLVEDIKQNRQHVLDVLAGEAESSAIRGGEETTTERTEQSAPDPADPAADATPAEDHAPDVVGGETEVSAADVMGSGPDTGGSETGQPDAGGREPETHGPDGDASSRDASGGPGAQPPNADDGQPVPSQQEPPAASADTGGAGGAGGPGTHDQPDTTGMDQRQPGADAGGGLQTTTREADATDSADETGTTAMETTDATAAERQGATADAEAATDEHGESAGVPRETVRITADVGDIFGVDQREYDLSTDDVVRLPADNVDPLVERDAAERL